MGRTRRPARIVGAYKQTIAMSCMRLGFTVGIFSLIAVSFYTTQSSAQGAHSGNEDGHRFGLLAQKPEPAADSIIPNRYIVVLKNSVAGPAQVARNQVQARGGKLGLLYRHALKGYSATLSSADAVALRRDPRVKYVTPDRRVEAFAQTVPRGIGRIFATQNDTLHINGEEDEWVDADVAVIDTGIDSFEQPELNLVAHTTCIPTDFGEVVTGCLDEEGTGAHYHGTHVAGTIAAIDDGNDVVGVAPGARLWGVKVLSDWGSGAQSWIVAGVDWVTAHASEIEVANMSLGCGPLLNEVTEEMEACELPAVEEAIDASIDTGVVYVVAAGNSGVDAEYISPAHNPDAITVSAIADYDAAPGGLMDPLSSQFCKEKVGEEDDNGEDDELASFSNHGDFVDVAAPGVCIASTWLMGEVGTISGTSMAAPHVAGAAAILASKSNPEDREDVEAIRDTIVEESNSDWTDTSGDGIEEPLLDVGEESVFDAETIEGEPPPPPQPSWEHMPGEGSGHLYDVSCATTDACIALRDDARSAHWDGEEWSFGSLPEPPIEKLSDYEPTGISCPAAEECVAVGRYTLGGSGSEFPFEGFRPTAWLWDGEEWAVEPALAPPEVERSAFDDVSCVAADFCVAVGWKDSGGTFDEALVEHWDGEEWSIMPTPHHAIAEGTSSAADVLSAVSCASTEDCLAVGYYERVIEFGESFEFGALALHWDGEEWSERTMPPSLGEAKDVSCAASDACVVLDQTARAAHWNGAAWSLEWLPRPLEEVSCPSANACMAVGGPVFPFGVGRRGQAVRWDGTRWEREVTAALPSEGPVNFMEFVSISCVEVPVGCVAVGGKYGGLSKSILAEDRIGVPPTVATGAADEVRSKQATLHATVNPEESQTTYRFEYGTTTAYGKTFPGGGGVIGQEEENVQVEETVEDLQPDTTYHFRISATNLESTTHGEDHTFTTKAAAPPVYASSFGKAGSATGQFNQPMGLDVDASGNIWVADAGNNRIEKFSSSGEFLLASGSAGTGNGQFNGPKGLAVDASNNVWVVDRLNHRVQKFDSTGKYLTQFGGFGSGNGQLNYPWGIDVDAEGKIWVVDSGNERVQHFSSSGVYQSKFSTFGPAIGIAADAQGNLWVSESFESRVRRFSPTGQILNTLDSGPWGEFNLPHGLTVDSDENVWVADTSNHRVRTFSADGTYLTGFGSEGAGSGQLSYPEDLAFGSDGSLWVVDTSNSRVQKWSFGAPEATTEGATDLAETGMTLNATVNPEGSATTYRFEYGLTQAYGLSVPASPESIGSGGKNVAVSKPIEELVPGRTYHFRVVATNAVGTSYGQDFTATTDTTEVQFSSAFGSSGSGNGQLESPADTAVDSKGNVWVVDRLNHRIQKFSAAGGYISQFGTKGAGNGQLNEPAGIAIDGQDNIWVTDIRNHRVQKFNSSGTYLAKFGSVGTGNGQFGSYGPKGIAIDPKGNLWVSDYSGRVQKFDSSGGFLKVVGSYGTGAGQFRESAGIDAGPGGKIWVSDWQDNHVSVFSEAGEFLFKFGSYGTGNGQFNHPDAVEVDSRGNVWVGEDGNDRVQLFDQTGQHLATFGAKGTGSGQFEFTWPMGLGADDKGNLWITDVSNHRIQRWLIPDYVPTYKATFGTNGSGNGQLKSPGDVARDSAGNLWVVDKGNNRVQKFSSSGAYLAQFGSYGTGNGQFDRPTSIAIGPSGDIWVADGENDRVQKFSSSGTYISQFGTFGTGNGQFKEPESITTDAKGNIWVCDTLNGRIQKFTAAGSFVKVVGSLGSGNGQFGQCTGIDVAPDGKIWAADWTYNRVNVFSEAGEFLFKFGVSGTAGGQFAHPNGVEVDFEGNVWVGDEGNHRVQLFDQLGEYVTSFGTKGSGAGQFSFSWPMALTSDDNGKLWVADVANQRVQRWAYAP